VYAFGKTAKETVKKKMGRGNKTEKKAALYQDDVEPQVLPAKGNPGRPNNTKMDVSQEPFSFSLYDDVEPTVHNSNSIVPQHQDSRHQSMVYEQKSQMQPKKGSEVSEPEPATLPEVEPLKTLPTTNAEKREIPAPNATVTLMKDTNPDGTQIETIFNPKIDGPLSKKITTYKDKTQEIEEFDSETGNHIETTFIDGDGVVTEEILHSKQAQSIPQQSQSVLERKDSQKVETQPILNEDLQPFEPKVVLPGSEPSKTHRVEKSFFDEGIPQEQTLDLNGKLIERKLFLKDGVQEIYNLESEGAYIKTVIRPNGTQETTRFNFMGNLVTT
jgi:hypothetical protein